MLSLAYLQTHEGSNVAIPLYRKEDVFSFIWGYSFPDNQPSIEIEEFDILDLYQVEKRILLPIATSFFLVNQLSAEQQEALSCFLWNEITTEYPEIEELVPGTERDIYVVLWIGHQLQVQNLVIEEGSFSIYCGGSWITFDYQSERHQKEWKVIRNSLVSDIQVASAKQENAIFESFYESWEKEKLKTNSMLL